MRIFGISFTSLLLVLFIFWIGTRFPNAFGHLPLLGK